MNILLKKPLVSEKSMKLTKDSVYTFLVDRKARKEEIAKVVREQFGVDVLAVMTANFKEENRQQRGRRSYYKIAGFKKAMVQLKKGQKISLFESEKIEEAQPEEETKEKKSLLRGTKVKIEKAGKEKKEDKKSA